MMDWRVFCQTCKAQLFIPLHLRHHDYPTIRDWHDDTSNCYHHDSDYWKCRKLADALKVMTDGPV